MTRESAIAAAEREAATGDQVIAVYRFRGWPPAVFGVRAADRLPADAEKFEVFRPVVLEAPLSHCETADPSKVLSKTPSTLSAPAAGQGSLF